ncbi:AGE family epimerase/isomerase [Saccharibacillus alkalitolerans]|uniref:Cellobiose 2-epimerase n=1 Tax=Saccharibacillus alkalitolerans TaxID=2705290 RepID=A0ABX0F5X2_9BACL|nr:AGE family epimerase/isomerase [Saccharibacillus alkalitolerans]NGZ75330.1 N-acyl-D-glucosamine 2-epimerase [Saccharibacillus alkalitolerans]
MSAADLTAGWREELDRELRHNILGFWMEHAPAAGDSGFVGEIGADMDVRGDADRSLVLNARILWTFSAAYRRFGSEEYLSIADRAYRYLQERFLDRKYGGYYWMVHADGSAAETKKQVYGQAFAIYALSEYAQALDESARAGAAEAGSEERRSLRSELESGARELYRLIEAHSRDPLHGGYIEAHAEDWSDTEDFSLSGKDLNEKKSMNTHLHVLEGYTNLYRIWPSDELKNRLGELIEVTLTHIVDPASGHFRLFFDDEWNVKSDHVSYGHDIEGSWLLMEAAEALGGEALIERAKATALKMAEAVLRRGVDADGGIWNEASGGSLVDDSKDWWPQAEAMVGFYNAYELTGDAAYREAAARSWAFIRDYLVDREFGEWYWSVSNDRTPNRKEPKVSAWKCPYHNGRACLEMLARLERTEAALQESSR